MHVSRRWPPAVLALAAIAVSGCAQSEGFSSKASSDEGPASVQQAKGAQGARIVLSRQAAGRLGIRTGVIRAGAGRKTMPYAAVLYDPQGRAFAYANPAPLTYVRTPVEIARIVGRAAVLRAGPRAGTQVVIVGSAELLGTEYGVDG